MGRNHGAALLSCPGISACMPVSRRGARSRIDPISPVILSGGIGCSVIDWENNIGALRRQHKVYALDMLGDGLTDKPQGDRYALKDRAKFTCDAHDLLCKYSLLNSPYHAHFGWS